jgi:hypothetical protein
MITSVIQRKEIFLFLENEDYFINERNATLRFDLISKTGMSFPVKKPGRIEVTEDRKRVMTVDSRRAVRAGDC